MSAPYHTPSALGREPLTAAFWVLCAPFLFPVLVMSVVGGFSPVEGAFNADPPDRQLLSWVWLTVCISGVLQFAALSVWCQHIGAGAFAGRLKTSTNWLIAAIFIGPFLLIVPSFIVGAFMAGQDDWQFASEVNREAFTPEYWTLGYLVFGILIAPIVEEVTFRGVALGSMMARGLSPYAAAVLSSAAFAFIHLQYSPAAMGIVFVTGLGLAVLRLLSGSMLVPILAHMAANADMFVLQALYSAGTT